MEVFEEEDERPPCGGRLDVALPGAKRLLAIGVAAPREPHEWCQACLQPLGVVDSQEGLAELVLCLRRVVGLEDARVCLDDLAERPERDAVAVRWAPALSPVDELRPVVDPRAELGEQSRLADAWLACDRDELDLRLTDHALERVLEQTELAVAADERRRRRRFRVDSETARRRQRSPGRNGIAFALELERRQLLVA